MKAMILQRIVSLSETAHPLELAEYPNPLPSPSEVLIQVLVCGVCHTEIDEIEGRAAPARLPAILGHQVIGRVIDTGADVDRSLIGRRVGVAWIHSSCGECSYCASDRENLCARFAATGRDRDGGYAELMTAAADFIHDIPPVFSDAEAAPLLCAGAIGYRALRLTALSDGQPLGLCGFGASAHLVLMLARRRYPSSRFMVFARNPQERAFALEMGAHWAGDLTEPPPEKCAAIIDTTPAWAPLIQSLRALAPGGRLVVNAIRKEESDKSALFELDYPAHLWLEKEIKTVANITRNDVREFLKVAAEIPIRPEVEEYALEDANRALWELKHRRVRGAKILRVAWS